MKLSWVDEASTKYFYSFLAVFIAKKKLIYGMFIQRFSASGLYTFAYLSFHCASGLSLTFIFNIKNKINMTFNSSSKMFNLSTVAFQSERKLCHEQVM